MSFLMSFWRCSSIAFFVAASGMGGSTSSRVRREAPDSCGASEVSEYCATTGATGRKNAPTAAEATRSTLRLDGLHDGRTSPAEAADLGRDCGPTEVVPSRRRLMRAFMATLS